MLKSAHALTQLGSKQPAARRSGLYTFSVVLGVSSTLACGALTQEEAESALEEVKVSSQAQALTSESIELATHFTLGDAARDAGQKLHDFIRQQLPCALVEFDANASERSARLSIEYGKLPGSCTYRGQTLSGKHSVEIVRSEPDFVVVDHTWQGLSNGKVSVEGAATVEWNLDDPSRHVVHDMTWTRLKDGQTAVATGDRVQRPLAGGLLEGFSVAGAHQWEGPRGQWDLAIDQVEMRWVDPVPQAGSYTLDTPFNKRVNVSFERLEPSLIKVNIQGPKRSFDFNVRTLPEG